MNWRVVCMIAFVCLCWPAFSQEDNIGSGRGLVFDGIDDYIILDHSYPTLKLPFSVSAWVKLDPGFSGSSPIFVTNDNDPLYHGFWFAVGPTEFHCEFGDGDGGNNPFFRRGKVASISNIAGKWVHVTAVMNSETDIALYFNGINAGGTLSGESSQTMASSYASDRAKIGYFYSNNVTYLMHGVLDEVRLWNRALTQEEVRESMCKKLIGNENGLVGYWTFNELSGTTTKDKSASGNNGHFIGNPSREFSGAPIGDKSVYSYPSSWDNTFAIKDGNDSLVVNNVSGNPEGIQLYEVFDKPSQVGGLDVTLSNKPYFGVYLASLDVDNTFDVVSCSLYQRDNNKESTWLKKVIPVTNVVMRGEFVNVVSTGSTDGLHPDLGPDKVLCDVSSTLISSGITDPGVSFHWSTGETTPEITVTNSGKYRIDVSKGCTASADSIIVSFSFRPLPFSLGADETLCVFSSKFLTPYDNAAGLQFLWQDGSKSASYEAKDFGSYWVTVFNGCGQSMDTVLYSRAEMVLAPLPNVITANGDGPNDFFQIPETLVGEVSLLVINRWGKEVYRSPAYKNDWNGNELDAGVYFLRLTGNCIPETKSSLTIIK